MISFRDKVIRSFLTNTEIVGDCWEWQGWLDPKGYGRIPVRMSDRRTHRVSYRAFNGVVGFGEVVRHTCDNRKCVRPEHLLKGTHADNARDRNLRGRTAREFRIHKTILSDNQVIELRQLRTKGASIKDLSRLFKVAPVTVSHIANGTRRK